MIDVYCEGCGAVVLLWPSNVRGLSKSPHGTVVQFRCSHGHEGVDVVDDWLEKVAG